jgi:8-oxo-dGTP pyrophosphatase MutT (NUDIX family)
MERTLISQRFALAPAPGRRSAPTGAIQDSVVAVPMETTQSRRGDHDLNPDMLPTRALIPAAVLVGLVERPEGMGVLFTKRTPHLNDHAGQISFPGGRIEDKDEGPLAAALRETEEEIGLSRENVTFAGYLEPHLVLSGFWVTPVVGFVQPGFALTLDRSEVDATFEVPLLHILDPTNHKARERTLGTTKVRVYDIPYGEHHIWGATAGMLIALYRLLNQ